MPIRTIDTMIDVGEDHSVELKLPPDIPVGRHRIIAIIDEQSPVARSSVADDSWTFPVVKAAQWPDGIPVNREEMYGDDGR